MYISTALGWGYFAMPRCASNAVATWFTIGYQARRPRSHHSPADGGDPDLQVFTTIRNPYERALSKWCARRMFPWSHQPAGIAAFQQWLARACNLPFGRDSDCLPRPMAEWLDRLQRPVTTVAVERLSTNLLQLPFANRQSLRHLHRSNSSNHRPWRDYYTPALYAAVASKYAADFQRWGYPTA